MELLADTTGFVSITLVAGYRIRYIGQGKGIPSEVLDGSLATGVRGIEARESTQQSSYDRDDLSAVRDVLGGLFQDKEGGLGVDSANRSVSYLDLPVDREMERRGGRPHTQTLSHIPPPRSQ